MLLGLQATHARQLDDLAADHPLAPRSLRAIVDRRVRVSTAHRPTRSQRHPGPRHAKAVRTARETAETHGAPTIATPDVPTLRTCRIETATDRSQTVRSTVVTRKPATAVRSSAGRCRVRFALIGSGKLRRTVSGTTMKHFASRFTGRSWSLPAVNPAAAAFDSVASAAASHPSPESGPTAYTPGVTAVRTSPTRRETLAGVTPAAIN